jgi:hypothetical protein
VSHGTELLVGIACLAMAWPCWQRGAVAFRCVAIALALAGITAVVNASIGFVSG